MTIRNLLLKYFNLKLSYKKKTMLNVSTIAVISNNTDISFSFSLQHSHKNEQQQKYEKTNPKNLKYSINKTNIMQTVKDYKKM